MDHLAINEFDLCFKLLKNTEKLLLSKEEAEIPQILDEVYRQYPEFTSVWFLPLQTAFSKQG